MNRKLPPKMFVQRYKTRGGYSRTLYYVRFTDWKKKRRTFPAGPDFKLALEHCDRLLGLNRQEHDFDKPKETALSLYDAIENFFAVKGAKRSLDKDKLSAQRLIAFFGEDTSLKEVARIEEYKLHRLAQKDLRGRYPAPATINRELAFLKSVFRRNKKALDKIPDIEMYDENNERTRTASETEFLAIYRKLDPETRGVVIAYWETGMRESEALLLRWPMIDLEHDIIELPGKSVKTSTSRKIPISTAYKVVLLQLRRPQKIRPITDHVHTIQGRPWKRYNVSYRWRKACRAAGVKGLWIHDLRGTWITAKLRAGHDREFIKPISGHKTDSAFKRYVRPTLDDLRQVVKSGNAVAILEGEAGEGDSMEQLNLLDLIC